jgi:hypothetical protein
MSKEETVQKVKITIKESFPSSLLHKYLEDDKNGMNLESQNLAFIRVVIGMHGQEINAVLTDDMQFAVIHPSADFPVMVDYCFVEMDNVKPQGSCYVAHKMYRMSDNNDQVGIYVEMKFDAVKGVRYILLNTSMERIEGSLMTELTDDELDAFKFGERLEYYKD